MTLLGDVSREAFERMLKRLQGTGGWAEDDGYRAAELRGIAYTFQAATAVVLDAVEQHFPGLASSLLSDWEARLLLGNSPGRTDDQRRARLRLFQRIMPQLTNERLAQALRHVGTNISLYRVEDAVAVDYGSNSLSPYLVGVEYDHNGESVGEQELRAIKEAAERALPPGSWPIHLDPTDPLQYGSLWTEGQVALQRDERALELDADDQRMQYGSQFFPGMSELAEPLGRLLDSQWQGSGVSIVDGDAAAGFMIAVGGSVEPGGYFALDSGSRLGDGTISGGGWIDRYVSVAGYVGPNAIWGEDVEAVAGAARVSALGRLGQINIQLHDDTGAYTDLRLRRLNAELRITNDGASTLHFALFIRATPRLVENAAAVSKRAFIEPDDRTRYTMMEMLVPLHQDSRVWRADQANSSPAGGTVAASSFPEGAVRRFGLLLNARKPSAGTNEYVLDSSVDWRDRMLCFAYGWTGSNDHDAESSNPLTHSPHMESDDQGMASGDPVGIPVTSPGVWPNGRVFYNGHHGPPVVLFTRTGRAAGAGANDLVLRTVGLGSDELGALYARSSDGALCFEMRSGAEYDTTSLTFMVWATGRTGESYSVNALAPSPSGEVGADVLWTINDHFSMVQAHEHVPTDATMVEADQNFPTWSRRSACAPLGPVSRGSARVPSFEMRRLRLGDSGDSDFLYRQNLYGEVLRVVNASFRGGTSVFRYYVSSNDDRLFYSALEGRGDQIDWRDRIIHVTGHVTVNVDILYPSDLPETEPVSHTFYSGVFPDGSDELVIELRESVGELGAIYLSVEMQRNPRLARLVLRGELNGPLYYFVGTIWASPQLGFADVRR